MALQTSLAARKFHISEEYRDRGACGDHYCTGGHGDYYLVCSCGWETRFINADYPREGNKKELILGHRLQHVEANLGITYTFGSDPE